MSREDQVQSLISFTISNCTFYEHLLIDRFFVNRQEHGSVSVKLFFNNKLERAV